VDTSQVVIERNRIKFPNYEFNLPTEKEIPSADLLLCVDVLFHIVEENELQDIEDEFLKSLLEDYSIMLQKECYYKQSKEAIIETIEANEYEFYANGKLI